MSVKLTDNFQIRKHSWPCLFHINIAYEINTQPLPSKVLKGKVFSLLIMTQQPENCENRNDPDLVQTFLKKWWVESDFKAPNLPLSLRFKGSGCHYNSTLDSALKKCRPQYISAQKISTLFDALDEREIDR
jgi:hypothetical protein